MAFSRLVAIAATASLLSFELHAFTFHGHLADGRPVKAGFEIHDAGLRQASSSLEVDGTPIPSPRAFCVEDAGGFRCPHRGSEFAAELYPRFDRAGELVMHMLVHWRSGGVESVRLRQEGPQQE